MPEERPHHGYPSDGWQWPPPSYFNMTDDQLLQRANDGDLDAQSEYQRRHDPEAVPDVGSIT